MGYKNAKIARLPLPGARSCLSILFGAGITFCAYTSQYPIPLCQLLLKQAVPLSARDSEKPAGKDLGNVGGKSVTHYKKALHARVRVNTYRRIVVAIGEYKREQSN